MKNIRHNTSYLIFIVLFCCLGLGMAIGGGVIVSRNSKKLKTYEHVQGIVVDYKISDHIDDDGFHYESYAEIVEFQVNGETYRVINPISATGGVEKIGAVIDISYNPQNPYDCVFSTSSNSAAYIVLILLGCVFALASGIMLWGYVGGRGVAINTIE